MRTRFGGALALALVAFLAGVVVGSGSARAQGSPTAACAYLKVAYGGTQPSDAAARWMDEQLGAGRRRFVTTYVEMGSMVPVTCAY